MSDKKLPKAGELVKLTQYVHVVPNGTISFYERNCSMLHSTFGACVGETEVSFIMPNGDPVKSMVDSLEKAIEKEMAESHVRINDFKDKIQQLLAIGCDGGE